MVNLEGNYFRRSVFCLGDKNCCCALKFSSNLPTVSIASEACQNWAPNKTTLRTNDPDRGTMPHGGVDINTPLSVTGFTVSVTSILAACSLVIFSLLNVCFLHLFFWPPFFHGNSGCVLYATTLTGHRPRH